MNRGTLILVVGPSGAGKDTLIAGARERLKDDPRFVFPRRVITRAADARGEDHIAVDEAAFGRMGREGAFALSWSAHGFSYGILESIEADLAQGRHVIVNVSRGIVNEAHGRFAPMEWIYITVEPGLLRQRLEARNRETASEIAERFSAAVVRFDLAGSGHFLANESTVEHGGNEMTKLIRAIALGLPG